MNAFKEGWFTEIDKLWPSIALSLEVDSVLYKGKSKFQSIQVLQTKSLGKALILDGIIQCTEFDEFSYQEMISYLPLHSHPNPQKVLIVGGGDGGVAREVAKHPSVKAIDQVEIDDLVMEVSRKYLPSLSQGLDHPKLTLHVEDGFVFLKNRKNEYDVIITDSSDPVGPAVPLFQQPYFELMKSALKPNGIVCSQAGTPWTNLDIVVNTFKNCKQAFPVVSYGYTSVPTYPNGQIGFVLGSLNLETNFKEPLKTMTDEDLEQMKFRYYTSEVHRAAFALPKFLRDALQKV
ncbi:spermidine synthase isoform X2 [Cimex lectularius]|nr:spermidine synthase isoform X2 [Cimex lectularius]